jgi:hypothetical protein
MITPEIGRVARRSASDQHLPFVLRIDHDTIETCLGKDPYLRCALHLFVFDFPDRRSEPGENFIGNKFSCAALERSNG